MDANAALETKLKQLHITIGRTNAVLDGNQEIAIQRHSDTIKAMTVVVENQRRKVEENKIAAGEDETDLSEWNAQIETKLALADVEVKRIQKWWENRKQEKELVTREEQIKFEVKLHETKLKLQEELQDAKPKRESTLEQMAKLPKLEISKFEGSYLDWPRF